MRWLVVIFILISSISASAKTINVLFVGNSLTFMPDWNQPTVPLFVKNLLNERHIDNKIDMILHGGHTLANHWKIGEFQQKLKWKSYDYVFIQPFSIEALELPSCFREQGPFWETSEGPQGREDFLKYAKKMIALARARGATPIVIQPWTYQANHPWLQADFRCLKFPETNQTWFGGSMEEYQRKLDEGYDQLSAQTGVQILRIGRLWNIVDKIKNPQLPVAALYQEDHYHPTYLGSLLSAFVITEKITNLPASGFHYCPKQVPESLAKILQKLLQDYQNVANAY